MNQTWPRERYAPTKGMGGPTEPTQKAVEKLEFFFAPTLSEDVGSALTETETMEGGENSESDAGERYLSLSDLISQSLLISFSSSPRFGNSTASLETHMHLALAIHCGTCSPLTLQALSVRFLKDRGPLPIGELGKLLQLATKVVSLLLS